MRYDVINVVQPRHGLLNGSVLEVGPRSRLTLGLDVSAAEHVVERDAVAARVACHKPFLHPPKEGVNGASVAKIRLHPLTREQVHRRVSHFTSDDEIVLRTKIRCACKGGVGLGT